MPYFVRLPCPPASADGPGAAEHFLNIINGDSTFGQRELRRKGYAGYEPQTAAVICALVGSVYSGDLPRVRHPPVTQSGMAGSPEAAPRFTFFDVGANGGHYTFLCKALYRHQAQVVSFEPAPETYRWLSAINEANRLGVITENKAVSDYSGLTTLYLSRKSDASNSLNPAFRAHAGRVQVETTMLDEYCAATGRIPDVLKIDAETHELAVLRGARHVVARFRPFLVVECLIADGVDHGARIARELADIGGYRFYSIDEHLELPEQPQVESDANELYRDWLMSPIALDAGFRARVHAWFAALAECTREANVAPRRRSK